MGKQERGGGTTPLKDTNLSILSVATVNIQIGIHSNLI